MYLAVNDPSGTGTRAKTDKQDFEVCGKTGTSQVISDGVMKNDAWFIAFGPKSDPEVSVAVMIRDVAVDVDSGGKTAAPIAKQMLDKYISIYK